MKRMVKIAMSLLIVGMTLLLTSAATMDFPTYLHNYSDASKFYMTDPATGGVIPMECVGGQVFSCLINACVVRGSESDCWHVKN